jgi:hypothetical protein
MEQNSAQPFDDPALKVALRRSLGQETAPVGLRDRLKNLSIAAPIQDQKPIPLFHRSPLYRFAVAAVLVIGFGGLAYQVWQMNKSPYEKSLALSDDLYKAMTTTHSARANQSAGNDTVSALALASSLGGQIQRPVFVADLTKDGWTFKGGAVRQVGQFQAAQLFFTKGNSSISVFSLPAAAAPSARDGEQYDKLFNGSPIAGFTHSGGLYCIVGASTDDSLKIDDVKRLLEEHKSEISKT